MIHDPCDLATAIMTASLALVGIMVAITVLFLYIIVPLLGEIQNKVEDGEDALKELSDTERKDHIKNLLDEANKHLNRSNWMFLMIFLLIIFGLVSCVSSFLWLEYQIENPTMVFPTLENFTTYLFLSTIGIFILFCLIFICGVNKMTNLYDELKKEL